MVFTWHFIHVPGAVSTRAAPLLSILEEGHTGVALFMVLSGYLFAKIIGDRDIDYRRFLYNRTLRLGPLLLLVLAAGFTVDLVAGTPWRLVVRGGLEGLILPHGWPWDTWSVVVEAHFYVLLPALLYVSRRNVYALVGLVALAVAWRAAAFAATHEIRSLADYTLAGRIDQFACGILAWRLVRGARVNSALIAAGAVAFLTLFQGFNVAGGFYGTASSPIWVILPTAEGAFYALLIAWYDGGRWSLPSPFAMVGKVSYSIYLLHYLPANLCARWLAGLIDLSNFYVALAASAVAFIAFLPIAWLSWRFIETPATAFRTPYLKPTPPRPTLAAGQITSGRPTAADQLRT